MIIHVIAHLKWNLLMERNTYIDAGKGINDKDPKFEIGYIATVSKYKKIFANV